MMLLPRTSMVHPVVPLAGEAGYLVGRAFGLSNGWSLFAGGYCAGLALLLTLRNR